MVTWSFLLFNNFSFHCHFLVKSSSIWLKFPNIQSLFFKCQFILYFQILLKYRSCFFPDLLDRIYGIHRYFLTDITTMNIHNHMEKLSVHRRMFHFSDSSPDTRSSAGTITVPLLILYFFPVFCSLFSHPLLNQMCTF